MKSRMLLFSLLLIIVTGAFAPEAFAQNLPGGIWASPQSNATEGRLRSNADDFIRPDTYTGVSFNKMFGMVSFLWDENYAPIATAGFATKIKDIYAAGFYSGNFWANAPANNYIEMRFDPAPSGGVINKTYNAYTTISVVPEPVNNASILIGLADMGFRLTFRTNYQRFDKDDIVVRSENQLYKNYHAEGGYLAPQIAWAMAKDLSPNGIRPYATFDLVFDRDNQRMETSGADTTGFSGVKIDHSANSINPEFTAGLGGYTFYRKTDSIGAMRASADIDYALGLNIYSNEYSYEEGGKYKTGTIKGTYNPRIVPFEEKFYISNSLTPSVSYAWTGERAALRLKLNLLFSFAVDESNAMDLVGNKLVYEGDSDSTKSFTFRPDLRLAFQYKIIPDLLTLNAGARIQASGFVLEWVDRVYYNSGAKEWSQRIHQNSFGGGKSGNFASRFNLGLTLNFTENIWVEAMSGVRNAYGNEDVIDVFAPGGLFSFGSILVALKF